MKAVPLTIPDVMLLEPKVFGDARGFFFESWNARALAEAGIAASFVQDSKTTLTRGILRGLGFPGKVKSPTYTLVEPYTISSLYLYHFDLYRFADPYEWEEAGFRDYFNPDSVCLIEWPEKAAGLLPAPDLLISLAPSGTGRSVNVTAQSKAGQACLTTLTNQPLQP